MPFITMFPSKKNDKIFNADHELAIFKRLFNELELVVKGWPSFEYAIEKAPPWWGNDFEFIVYSKKEKS